MKSIVLGLFLAMPLALVSQAATAQEEKIMKKSTENSSSAGLILLALIGVVVATGGGMFATRNDNSLDIEATDVDDNAGF